MLVGRASQCAQIDALLARLSHGCGGSIVVSGEPGLGKTALLDYAADAASASALAPLVVWARGWESESELPFAALGDVVRPLSDALDELPESQRSSLRVALGVGQAVVEDRLTVYVAAHALLSVSAERRPVVVLIDDAQWLDQGSAQALAFAARRLRHEPVVMIAATRPNADVDLSGLEVITLEPLGDRDSRELLSRSPGMDGAAAELIMRQAGGLPLALIELPRLLSGGELRGPTDGAPMPIGSRLSELYGKLLSELPAATRRAALIAAADDRGDLLGISRALGSTGLSVHALEPAESSGVLMLTDHRVHFRHPLIRSAVYHGADPAERRAAHAALAAGMSDDGQFAERAWHRAAATAAPDAEVSRDLVTAAAQARARGAFPTAASMYERAAALAVSAHDRGSLLADAADAAQFDSPQRARMLLDRAAQDSGNGDLEAHIGRLRGRLEARGGSARLAHQVLVAAARSSASDPSAAARLLIESVDPAIRAGLVSAALESALEANELARRAGDDSAVLYAELAEAAARVFAGDAGRGRDLVVRVAEQAAATGEMSQDPQLTAYLGAILGFAEQLGRARDALERQVASARRASAPGRLVYPLIALAWVQRLAGGWQLASANLTEAVGLARETAQESDECWALGLLTWITETQGTGGGPADIDRLLQLARRLDLPFQELVAHAARAAGPLCAGDAEAALMSLDRAAELKRTHGYADATTHPPVIPDAVQMLVRMGDINRARALTDEFVAQAAKAERPSALALAARCRALVAGDEAEPLFDESLRLHDEAGLDPYQRARTALCAGEWLRRSRRRARSRELLREAQRLFEELNAPAWADRASRELLATGETPRRRDPSTADDLTPQELQLAHAVAEGKTNREVAAEFFISPKTVEAHLGRVYRKLNVRSRTELARHVLAEPGVQQA
jgi:DNA-binding CsgD family transcriptional regulator